MKKILVLVLMLVVSLWLFACKEEQEQVSDFEPYVLRSYELTIDKKSEGIQLEKNRNIVYLYKDVVGYDENKQPIYEIVASGLEFEIGDTVTVLDIQLENFDYSVIKLENGALDTSWHEYLEVI